MTTITVNDTMQSGYVYVCTEPEGKAFDPRFTPDLTPSEMLALGVFGGRYLRDCRDEFPQSWFTRAKLHPHGTRGHSPHLNYFEIEASQPLVIWQSKGWIHPDDPRGWFQWYCRYYQGRRHEDDDRQITRWIAMKRHITQVKKYCPPGEVYCRRRQRQALLHWAYDSRKI